MLTNFFEVFERIIFRRVVMSFLKKHWGSVAAILSPAMVWLVNFLTPSLVAYVKAHPTRYGP